MLNYFYGFSQIDNKNRRKRIEADSIKKIFPLNFCKCHIFSKITLIEVYPEIERIKGNNVLIGTVPY